MRSETSKAWGGQIILPPANLNQPRPIGYRERLGGLRHCSTPKSGVKKW
jgi:hypothetical protein